MAVTAAAGVLALVQALLALRLIPLGVRLLMRDAKVLRLRPRARAARRRWRNAAVLGARGCSFWLTHVPKVVHPWLGAALAWTALRPVMIYGACLAGPRAAALAV